MNKRVKIYPWGMKRERGREIEKGVGGGGGGRQTDRENSNSKTLFYKNCNLGLVKNLTTSTC